MAVDLIIGALVGFGASELIGGMSKGPKAPSQATLPSKSTADAAGESTVANQRAAMLAAGGQTDQTGGLGFITGADTSKSSLIGA